MRASPRCAASSAASTSRSPWARARRRHPSPSSSSSVSGAVGPGGRAFSAASTSLPIENGDKACSPRGGGRVALDRDVAENAPLVVAMPRRARIDPEVAPVTDVHVDEAAGRIDPDAHEAELARVLGHVRVGRAGDDEVDGAPPSVVGGVPAVRGPVGADHADLLRGEVGLHAVDEVDEARLDGVRVARGRLAKDARDVIEIERAEAAVVRERSRLRAVSGVQRDEDEEGPAVLVLRGARVQRARVPAIDVRPVTTGRRVRARRAKGRGGARRGGGGGGGRWRCGGGRRRRGLRRLCERQARRDRERDRRAEARPGEAACTRGGASRRAGGV